MFRVEFDAFEKRVTDSNLVSIGFVLAFALAGVTEQGSCQTRSNSPAPVNNQANNRTGMLVTRGVWGGDHIRMEVEDDSAAVEYDCAHGMISGPLKVDGEGHFRARGTVVREHGGPTRDNETPPNRPADYSGSINGDRMTLTVTLTDSSESVGRFTLVRGSEGNLVKCR